MESRFPLTMPGRVEQAIIGEGDTVLFMNFRADRARQLSHAFVDTDFPHFARAALPQQSDFVMTTEYAADAAAPSDTV